MKNKFSKYTSTGVNKKRRSQSVSMTPFTLYKNKCQSPRTATKLHKQLAKSDNSYSYTNSIMNSKTISNLRCTNVKKI